jgi:hypothetical protein
MFSTQPSCSDAPMVLLVLDLVLSMSETYDRIVKAVDELQDILSKVYLSSMKQRSIDSHFKKQCTWI